MNTHESRRGVDLIGAACGRGGADAGCAQGPARLRAAGIDTQLRAIGADVAWSAALETRGGGSPLAVSRFGAHLAAEVSRSLGAGRLPCVIGGDHSIAVGTWTGVAAHAGSGAAFGSATTDKSIGLVWIDAHLDSHTPVPVRMAAYTHARRDPARSGRRPALRDSRPRWSTPGICAWSAREATSAWRAHLLDRLGVRVIDSRELRERGLAAALDEALAIAAAPHRRLRRVARPGCIDASEAPGVATPVPRTGLAVANSHENLRSIAAAPQLLALEIAEYCPRRDREGTTERAVIELLGAWLGDGTRNRSGDRRPRDRCSECVGASAHRDLRATQVQHSVRGIAEKAWREVDEILVDRAAGGQRPVEPRARPRRAVR